MSAVSSPLVRHPSEWRQIGIVTIYIGLLAAMYFVPACRNPLFYAAAFYFSFLNSVVIHNHLHQGIFHRKSLNMGWRLVLSFGALYPASANIPSHNLVHHHFEEDGQPDWADPEIVHFRYNLLNLIHFPNVAGPQTFSGVQRWKAVLKRKPFTRQYYREQFFAFGLTAVLLVHDFWTGLFFVVLPQLWGARGILRINIIQHDGCDLTSEWNHSRNFVGRAFNWIMCNNGYHTIHHNKAGLHWSQLAESHNRDVVPRIDPSLDEPSMFWYLLRTYGFRFLRPTRASIAAAEQEAASLPLASRVDRCTEAAARSGVSGL